VNFNRKAYRKETFDAYPIFPVNFFDNCRAPHPYWPARPARIHDPSLAAHILKQKEGLNPHLLPHISLRL